MEVMWLGNIMPTKNRDNPNQGRVYSAEGLAPSLTAMQGGGREPMIIETQIVAMRGRNPDNPTSGVAGLPTEQRLEPNQEGICNTITTVQKDNMVMETVRIKQATEQGYAECKVGGVADFSYPSSKTRRGSKRKRAKTCSAECWKEIVRIKAKSRQVPIKQFNLEGNLVRVWESAREAQKETGYYESNINKCCNGKINTYKGYRWEYA